MKKFWGKFGALCLSIVLFVSLMPMHISAISIPDEHSYAIFAGKDISCSGNVINVNGNIHANRMIFYQCLDGVINGTSTSAVVRYGNSSRICTRNEIVRQNPKAMIRLDARLKELFFLDETRVQTLSQMDNNLNINENIYSQTSVLLGGNVDFNHAALGAVNKIEIGTQKVLQGYNVNANQSVLYCANGDIIIDVDNFNFNGLIYAPNGNVQITSKGNVGIHGIIIAQNVSLQGGNINLQNDISFANLIFDDMEKKDDSDTGNQENGSDGNSHDLSQEVPKDETDKEGWLDTDGDGLIDDIENEIGTDATKPDSDGDNLSDYDEVYFVGTNPLKSDSNGNDIRDDQDDLDGDGLNNLEEIKRGTFANLADTDFDGLVDGDEGDYSTDPLDTDTDDDGLWDGDEIAIGLDPCNPNTYGMPDADYTTLQCVDVNSDIFSKVNVKENAYALSIEAKVSGSLQTHISAEETGYRFAIENDSMVGLPIELTYDGCYKVDEVTLSFNIKDAYIANEICYFSDIDDEETYNPELVGIKRLQVFKYFEDDNMLLPIETYYDTERNAVITVVDEFGVYCLIDMEKWILNLSQEYADMEQASLMNLNEDSAANDFYFSMQSTQSGDIENDIDEAKESEELGTDTEENICVNKEQDYFEVNEVSMVRSDPIPCSSEGITQKDIVFVLSAAGTNEDAFNEQVKIVKEASEHMLESEYDVRISVIVHRMDEAEFLNDKEWHNSYNEIKIALDKVNYIKTNSWCNRGRAFDLLLDELEFRSTAAKYVYYATNGYSRIEDNCASQLDLCRERNVIYSEICSRNYSYFDDSFGKAVFNSIQESGGEVFRLGAGCLWDVLNHLDRAVDFPLTEFNAIVATGWKKIVLVDSLNAVNNVDTDDDSISDWEEVDVDNRLITIKWDGSVELPTIEKCLKKHQKVYVQEGLERLLCTEGVPTNVAKEVLETILQYRIMPINSDPTSKDSDRDEIVDYVDDNPLCYDYIPYEFLRYMTAGYIELSDLRRAGDGFTICMKPLGQIMNEMGNTAKDYTTFTVDGVKYEEYNGMNGNEYYFSDWFLYGFLNKRGETVYGLIKMRTCENTLNKEPGVSIPFREFDITLLDEAYNDEDLGNELENLTQMSDSVSDTENVRGYFGNASNKTNYFLADVYIELILRRDNLDGNRSFEVPDNVLPRVTERLKESTTVYNEEDNSIIISDLNNLTLEERQCLLVSRAGTISYNAWAAEIVAHAFATKIILSNNLLYNSAKKADLGSSEGGTGKEKVVEQFFAYDDSIFVVQQRGIFGDF